MGGKATPARSNVSWSRMGIRVVNSESKSGVIKRLENSLSKRARVGQEFIVGFNSLMKKLENITESSCETGDKGVALVCICRDSPAALHNRVVEAANIRKIPVVILSSFTAQLSLCFKLKRANCFAVSRQTASQEEKKNSIDMMIHEKSVDERVSSDELLSASLDSLVDYMIACVISDSS